MKSFKVHSVRQVHTMLWSIDLFEVDGKGQRFTDGDSISWYSVTEPKGIFIGGIYEIGMTFVGALNS